LQINWLEIGPLVKPAFLHAAPVVLASTTETKAEVETDTTKTNTKPRSFLTMTEYQCQLLWNSSTANSPDSARVYRATIAPDDQPAAALTFVHCQSWIAPFGIVAPERIAPRNDA
jgi:hypothetical protein